MADANKIMTLLKNELDLQTRHCRLLEAQQKALLACDRPRFAGMQAEQELMLKLLEAQKTAREAEMVDGEGNFLALTALIEKVPPQQQRMLHLLRENLRVTLEKIQRLSVQNQKLIQNELEYIAFMLDLYVEAGRKAQTTYGPYGAFRGRLLLDRRA